MRESEAVTVVAVLASYFPGKELAKETIALWAHELLAHDVRDGMAAARSLGTGSKFMPSLATLVDEIRIARRERELDEVPALPAGETTGVSFPEWLETQATPAEQSRIRQFIDGLRFRRAQEEGAA